MPVEIRGNALVEVDEPKRKIPPPSKERTYKILVTLNVETNDEYTWLNTDDAVKECIYAHLQDLMDDDNLHFELEVQGHAS